MNNINKIIYTELLQKSSAGKKFIDEFYETIQNNDKLICYKDANEWIGFKKKQTVKDILLNEKYNFANGTDFTIKQYKPKTGRPGDMIYMTIDTIKVICLMAPTQKGQQFRRYYIEMEKLFKQYVSTKIFNKLNNPIPELNKHDFDVNKYKDKEVLYIINIIDNLYKFGITNNIYRRLKNHEGKFKYQYVVKCWDCTNRTVSRKIENDIKKYIRINKLQRTYNKATEVLEIDEILCILEVFNQYVDIHNAEYENKFINKRLEQECNIVKSQIEFLKQLENLKYENPNANLDNLVKLIQLQNTEIDKEDIKINKENAKIIKEELIKKKSIIEKQLSIPKKSVTKDPLGDKLKNHHYCKKCRSHKLPEEFGINERTKMYYKQCIKCREEGRRSDRKRAKTQKRVAWNKINGKTYTKKYREKKKNEPTEEGYVFCNRCRTHKSPDEFGIKKSTNELFKSCISCRKRNKESKKKQYGKDKEKILERNRQYYQKNKDNIIDHKKDYAIQKQFEEHAGKIFCKCCRSHKPSTEYDINIKTKKCYKQCNKCRSK